MRGRDFPRRKRIFSMETWLIALIVLIIVHYFLAILSVFFVLRDYMVPGIRIRTGSLILWNLICLFVPVIGPCTYLIARNPLKKRREKWAEEHPLPRKDTETASASQEDVSAGENPAANEKNQSADSNSGANTVNR